MALADPIFICEGTSYFWDPKNKPNWHSQHFSIEARLKKRTKGGKKRRKQARPPDTTNLAAARPRAKAVARAAQARAQGRQGGQDQPDKGARQDARTDKKRQRQEEKKRRHWQRESPATYRAVANTTGHNKRRTKASGVRFVLQVFPAGARTFFGAGNILLGNSGQVACLPFITDAYSIFSQAPDRRCFLLQLLVVVGIPRRIDSNWVM